MASFDTGNGADSGRGQQIKSSGKQSVADKFIEWSLNWVPDSMVFVVSLTIVVYLVALVLTPQGPLDLLDDYAKGFWILLTFAMQLSLMMITGYVIADSRLVKGGIVRLIGLTTTARSTLMVFCLIVGAVTWLHWAAGLMVAIVLGKEVAIRKRGLGLHYPGLVAAAYIMVNVMANGPSQSAPLLAATAGNFLEKTIGGTIPLTQTALSPFLLAFVGFQFVSLPIIIWLMQPKGEKVREISDAVYNEINVQPEPEPDLSTLRPAERWERSRVLLTILGAALLIWVARFLSKQGIGKLDLNILNFALFGMGMVLHGSPRSFMHSVRQGVGTTYGVIIQFPLYAGIFGIIMHSGLSEVITHWFLSISTTATYSWIVMVYTTIMDFFVPSGGSKFAIEAPYILPAGTQLGIPVPHVINAYSTGAQMANLIQPFWALPFLAAFKIRFQDILPYTFLIAIYVFLMGTAAFLAFPKGW